MNRVDKDKIYSHLAHYKDNVLKIKENGIDLRYKKEHAYILPIALKSKNLISSDYEIDLLKCVLNYKNNLHNGFHHLNSSQALAFNLFVPLMVEGFSRCIYQCINEHYDFIAYEFEHIEDKSEYTNFDFFIRGINTNKYFEIKYTEDKFGSCKNDDEHINKYKNIYKEKLSGIVDISFDEFSSEYQLWRNIIYSRNGVVVFVYPSFRSDLDESVLKAISKMNKYKENIKILHIESLLAKIEVLHNVRITNHYNEFRRKYLEIERT